MFSVKHTEPKLKYRRTTFHIYLPLIDAVPDMDEEKAAPAVTLPGVETLLLAEAEDDNQLRVLTKSMLEGYGYRVIAAEDGEDAVKKFSDYKDTVIFTSGYPDDVFNKTELVEMGLAFLPKPLVPTILLEKIRSELDRKAGTGTGCAT